MFTSFYGVGHYSRIIIYGQKSKPFRLLRRSRVKIDTIGIVNGSTTRFNFRPSIVFVHHINVCDKRKDRLLQYVNRTIEDEN